MFKPLRNTGKIHDRSIPRFQEGVSYFYGQERRRAPWSLQLSRRSILQQSLKPLDFGV
jgi:hypothetical protein